MAAPHTDDSIADDLRGFGPLGLAVLVVLIAIMLLGGPIVGGLAVLAWRWASRTPWANIGYRPPANWWVATAGGAVFGCGFKLLMKAIVMPLFGAPETNQAYQYLVGNRAALPVAIGMIVVGAGFGEETVFRGFAFERLGRWLGHGRVATAFIVGVMAVLFGLAHYQGQGVAGAEQATITGLVFGAIFAATRRLWFVMVAHVAFDFTAVAIIYFNLERAVVHWVWA